MKTEIFNSLINVLIREQVRNQIHRIRQIDSKLFQIAFRELTKKLDFNFAEKRFLGTDLNCF